MICRWITAHSGCEGTPDNSEKHLHAAVASGADALEVDVRRMGGELVLAHNLPETGEGCVTLAHCFQLVGELSQTIRINCDLKEPALERDVLELARRMGLPGRVILTGTVNPSILAELPGWAMVSMNIENLLPGFYQNLEKREKKEITPEEAETLLRQAKHYGISSFNFHYPLFQEGFYRKMREAGISFSLWTVNDAEKIRELLAFELENITTRKPVLACQLRAEMGSY